VIFAQKKKGGCDLVVKLKNLTRENQPYKITTFSNMNFIIDSPFD